MNTTERFSKLFTQLDFLNPEVFRISDDQKQYLFLGEYGGGKSIIKLYDKSETDKAGNIAKEFELTKFLDEAAKEKKIDMNFIRVKSHGEFENFFWVIREFVDGNPLGKMNPTAKTGVDRYANINSEFVGSELLAKEIFNQLGFLRKIPIKVESKLFGKRFDFTRSDVSDAKKLLSEFNIESDFDLSELSSSRMDVLSVKDLTPSNILISKEHKVYLFDFEWLGLDNYLFDLAFVWLFSFKDKTISAEIKRLAVRNDEDEILFNKNVVRIIYFYLRPSLLSGEIQKYRGHIWLEILRNSLVFLSCQSSS